MGETGVGEQSEAKKIQGGNLEPHVGLPCVASLKNGPLAYFCIPPGVGSSFLLPLLWPLPGRRSFIPRGQGQPPGKSSGSPGCPWAIESSPPAQKSLRCWRRSPWGLFCFRLGTPGFSRLSHTPNLTSRSLYVGTSSERVSPCPYPVHSALGLIYQPVDVG